MNRIVANFSLIVIIGVLSACAVKKQNNSKIVGKEITTDSGLKYTVNSAGSGTRAKAGDIVKVHYTGKLTDGTIFDSSVQRNKPFQFKLGEGQVIAGWDEGISQLYVGDKATITIPSELGYGDRDMGKIPPNSTLVFDVELLSVTEPVKPFETAGKDTVTTESGLQYIKLNENGEGKQAEAGDMVYVHYSGFLQDGKLFDSSVERDEPFVFPLGQGKVIRGWDEGISLLREGEKAKFIIPSDLAYGERGYPPVIPQNATLIFDVELLTVQKK